MPSGISIVIVSYHVRDLLRACLASVFAQEIPGTEVIVIDNASSDGTLQMIREEFPQVKLIANEKNAGFSAANNQGMQLAKGDFIFLLNPDTELRQGALQAMLDFAAREKELFLLGPRLYNSDGSLQVSAWKSPGVWNTVSEALFLHRLLKVSEYPQEQFEKTFSPGMLSGAALFFPKALFEKIGGLDPELFWMEDADFSYRAAEAGAKLVYFPAAEVIHHSGQSSKKNQKVVIANQLLSKLKYYRKHQSFFAFLIGALFCFLHIVSRIVLFGLAGIFSRRFAEKAGAYVFALGKYFRYLFANDKRVT